jgi:hypothetical protein
MLEMNSHRISLVSGIQHAFQEGEMHKKFPVNTETLMEGEILNLVNVHTAVT